MFDPNILVQHAQQIAGHLNELQSARVAVQQLAEKNRFQAEAIDEGKKALEKAASQHEKDQTTIAKLRAEVERLMQENQQIPALQKQLAEFKDHPLYLEQQLAKHEEQAKAIRAKLGKDETPKAE